MKNTWWPRDGDGEEQPAWVAYLLMAVAGVVFLLALWGAPS